MRQTVLSCKRLPFDAKHTVLVNQDEYRLFPEFYAKVKQEVGKRHSVIGLFGLLEDYLED